MIVSTPPLAEEELVDGAVFYAEGANAKLGERFHRRIRAVDPAIAHVAKVGSPWRGAIRRLPIRRFPYSIVYYLSGDVLRVIAVAHQRRRPGFWRGRV